MSARIHAPSGVFAAVIAALTLFVVPASAHASVSRSAAAKTALRALKVASNGKPVRVFETAAPVAARTPITESGASGHLSTDRKTGVQSGAAERVLSTPDEPVWLFYADQGPHQGFQHPGRLALVGERSGKVTLSATLAWVPLVNGREPAFFASAGGYEGSKYVVFDRPWPGVQAADASTPLNGPATAAQRAGAQTLAAQHACVLRYSDTLGNFFDFGRVDQTRANLGRFFNLLAALDTHFITERYLPSDKLTPAAAAQRLISKYGCRDLLLYAAGAGTKSGATGVVIGLSSSHGQVKSQTLSLSALRSLLHANPKVSFKLVFDAPYSGRLAAALRSQPNVAVLLASGGPDTPSFAYLPSLTGPDGISLNTGNPQHLLEFSNALISGLGRFAASAPEIDQAMTQTSQTFLGWMLARAVDLAGAPFGGHLTSPVELVPGTTAPSGSTTVSGSTKTNHPPVAQAASQTTNEDTPLTFTLGGSDPDGDALSYTVTSPPAHGTLSASGAVVTYSPSQDYNGPDQLTYTVSDGLLTSAPATVDITVNPVDDAPQVLTTSGSAGYTEQAAPVIVDPGLTLTDVDNATLTGATVTVSPSGADVLHFADQNGITGAFDATSDTLTLSGTASVAAYQAALRSVTFDTPGDNPSTTPRSIIFRATDGQLTGFGIRQLNVVAVNDPPQLSTSSSGSAAYTEDGPSTTLDSNITVSDPDSPNLASAKVVVGNGESTDRLDFSVPAGMTGSFNASTDTLTFTGNASQAAYQTALRSVTFHTVSDNPSETTRQLTFQVGDGAALSNVLTRGLTVTRHNDPPVVTLTAGSAAFTEGGAPAVVDGALTVTDPDSPNLAGATVQIDAADLDAAHDSLSFTQVGTITGAYDAAHGTLTMTGADTPAHYQQALRSVVFSNSNDDPTTSRTLAFGVTDDAGAASTTVQRALTIAPVNDPPTVTAPSGGSASYMENGTPVAVEPGLTVSDPDSASLAGATVAITSGFAGGVDVLHFTDQGGISGSYAADTGVLTLTGAASPAAYQAALRTVTFEATGDNPGGATRTVSFTANDGQAASAPASRNVTVTPVDDAPTVTTSAGDAAWTEGNPATPVDPGVTVSDPDSPNLSGALVAISAGTAQTGDELTFSDGGGITGSYDASVHTLTLTGTATVAAYQAALRSVAFDNTTQNPHQVTRHVTFTAIDDGGVSSAGASRDVDVTEVNSAPVVTTSPGSAAFVEDAGPVAVDPGVAVGDADSPSLVSAQLQITTGYDAGHDSLTYAAPAGNPVTAGTFNALTGTLTLSGAATPAQYQDALRAVQFSNDDDNPVAAARTVVFTVDDGSALNHLSAAASRDVTVTPVNDPPTIHTSSGSTPYPERDDAVAVDPALTVTDPDSTALTTATVTIKTGEQSGDVLSFDAPPSGITGSVNAAGDTLTFTGQALLADYQTALRGVRFASSNHDPSASRTIAFTASDTGPVNAQSAEADKTVSITPVDDAPVVTTSAGATSYTENAAPAAVDGALTVADADNTDLQGATVAITGNFRPAEDSLAFTDAGGIQGSYANGVLTLSGDATPAAYQAALRSVTYADSSDNPDPSTRTVSFTANDGTLSGAAATKAVSVTPVDDPPAVTTSAGATTFTEDGSAAVVDAGVTVSDPDNTTLAGATVAVSAGGVHGEDVLGFTPAGNITGVYDPASGTLTLSGADTVAAYQSVLRSVTYADTSQNPSTADRTLTFTAGDGSATSAGATKTVHVVAVNDAPVLSGTGTVTFTENSSGTPSPADATAVAPDIGVADVDSASLTGATVQLTTNYQSGEDLLAFANTSAISGSFDAASGTLTLSGSDTVAHYQAALRAVSYRDTSANPSAAPRTVRFIADDGQSVNHASAPLDRGVAVVPFNNPPTAAAHTYNGASRAVGNTTLVVHDAANGTAPAVTGAAKTVSGNLTSGATDPDGPSPATVVPATGEATSAGGRVDLLADGDFVYHPKAGFTGNDTFTYTLTDGTGTSAPATVTVDVETVVWYADANASATGADGTSAHPFPTLAPFRGAGAIDATGATLFLYPGTYDGGLTLAASETVLGGRNGLIVPDGGSGSVTLVSAAPSGAASELDGGTVLANNDVIQGVDFGSSAVYALTGNGVTATVDTVTPGSITNPAGATVGILGLNNTIHMAFATLTGGGLALDGAVGTFTATDGTISGTVAVQDGEMSMTLGGTVASGSSTAVIVDGEELGKTLAFNGDVSGANVDLQDSNANIDFSGGLQLSNTFGTIAFFADNAGTVAVTGPGNTLSATNADALDVVGTTIDAAGLKFQSISTSNAAHGIELSNTGSAGSLTVTGNGGTCTAGGSGCDGGTIANGTGADDTSSTPAGTGIVLNQTDAPSFTNMYLHDFSNYAVHGNAVTGFTMKTSVIAGTNGTSISGADQEGSVRFTDLLGTATIDHTSISGGVYDNMRVIDDQSESLTLSVTNSSFGAMGSRGNDALNLESTNGANITATVDHTTFTSADGDIFQAALDGGDGSVTFTNNTVSNNAPAILPGGGGVVIEGGEPTNSTTTVDVEGNTFSGSAGDALHVIKGKGSGIVNATIQYNTVGVPGVGGGTATGDGIDVESDEGQGTMNASLTGNTVRNYNGDGIHLQAGDGDLTSQAKGDLDVSLLGNVVANPGTASGIGQRSGLALSSGVVPEDAFNVCLALGANTIAGSGAHGGPDFILRDQDGSAVKLISPSGGYTGTKTDTAAVQSFVQQVLGGSPAPSGVVQSDSSAAGFSGGTTCL